VTRARTVLLTAPWTGDPGWTGGQDFRRTTALVALETDEGIHGLGETTAGYFTPETVVPLVDYYGALLTDEALDLDPLEPSACVAELYQRSLWWGRVGLAVSVLSGVEMAMWDIAGKAAGRPVHALLGGAVHRELPVYASGGTSTWPAQRAVEQVGRYVERGFRAVKIGTGFVGRPEGRASSRIPPPYGTWYARTAAERVADEVAKLAALRDAFGAAIDIGVDSHAVQIREPWSRASALAIATAVEPYDPMFYEEPLRYDDPEGYAWLRSMTRVPIVGGECLTWPEFGRYLDLGALDAVQPDASHAGGIGAVLDVASAAAHRSVGLIVHTGGTVGPGLLANVHAAFASPNSRMVELALAPDNVREAFLAAPLAIVDGMLQPPRAPGLGVTLPDDLADRWPYEPGWHEYA
jgi:L-alanine-DL-glutamate epimerase-like enolase superfamily enzyme